MTAIILLANQFELRSVLTWSPVFFQFYCLVKVADLEIEIRLVSVHLAFFFNFWKKKKYFEFLKIFFSVFVTY